MTRRFKGRELSLHNRSIYPVSRIRGLVRWCWLTRRPGLICCFCFPDQVRDRLSS